METSENRELTVGFHNRGIIHGLDKSRLSEIVERGTHLIGEDYGEEGRGRVRNSKSGHPFQQILLEVPKEMT